MDYQQLPRPVLERIVRQVIDTQDYCEIHDNLDSMRDDEIIDIIEAAEVE